MKLIKLSYNKILIEENLTFKEQGNFKFVLYNNKNHVCIPNVNKYFCLLEIIDILFSF
jgi:hypothetical protein